MNRTGGANVQRTRGADYIRRMVPPGAIPTRDLPLRSQNSRAFCCQYFRQYQWNPARGHSVTKLRFLNASSAIQRKFRMSMTSLVRVPRASTNSRPSRERANRKMTSDLKLVNCLGGSPLMGWPQMLETPLRFWT